MRVTDVFGSAFVATGAATDGLFARLSRKLAGRSEATDVSALKKIFAEWSAEEIEKRKQESDTEMINLKALKAAIKDEARLTRALTIVASGDAETLTVESVVAMLDTEDAKAQSAAAAAAIEKAKTLEAELAAEKAKAAEAEAKLAKVATLGVEKPLAPSIGQASERFTGLTAKLAPLYAEKGINLTIGGIADMIVPAIWIQGMSDEPIVEKNEIIQQRIAPPLFSLRSHPARARQLTSRFSGAELPDAIQVESTEPTINTISQIKTVAPILNRDYAFGATRLQFRPAD
jgi:flagellum-specific peptidoglycan hydrolase FlgJ